MKRILWICILVLGLILNWTPVYSEDFLVIPVKVEKKDYAPVEKTGQVKSYAKGDDGSLQKGVGWPDPRFKDNDNGTVTDNLTGLIWMKDASCLPRTTPWFDEKSNSYPALEWANGLHDGCKDCGGTNEDCGLSDGSQAGDWRLPNVRELQSLIDFSYTNPALSNTAGTAQWEKDDPFTDVQSGSYWSSSTLSTDDADRAWYVGFGSGGVGSLLKINSFYVWCVRDGN